MGFLGDLFDDVVDIAAAPIKVSAKIIDTVVDSDIEGFVDELKDSAKN